MKSTMMGGGVLDAEQQEKALEMLRGGKTQQQVARKFGVTKNVISGIWHRHGDPVFRAVFRANPTTVFDRCDALHARMDRVLAETMGVGKIREPEQEPRR